MKILFVGGGTLGPVMPLIAVSRALRRMKPDAAFAWIGTPDGPESPLIAREGIEFHSLRVAKLDRFFSWRWLTFPFDWARTRREAARLLKEIRPDAVVTAGGFTAAPIVLAAAKMGIPCATHQLDLETGLANQMIARKCASVTTSFEYEHAPFGDRVHDVRIATPVAIAGSPLPSREKALAHFGLRQDRPTIFIFGGGTGSQKLNEMIGRTRDRLLSFAQVLHATGIGKEGQTRNAKHLPAGNAELLAGGTPEGYAAQALFGEDMREAYAAADVVICRAGMGTLSEIAWSKKTAILVPIPASHQEQNARAFEERGAAVVIDQRSTTFDEDVLEATRLLLGDAEERRAMGERAFAALPTDDGSELAKRVMNII